MNLASSPLNTLFESAMLKIISAREELTELQKQDEARLLSETYSNKSREVDVSKTYFNSIKWKQAAELEAKTIKWYPQISSKWLENVITSHKLGKYETESKVVSVFEETLFDRNKQSGETFMQMLPIRLTCVFLF